MPGRTFNSYYVITKDTSYGVVLNRKVVRVVETYNYAFGVIAIRVMVQTAEP